MRKRIFEIIERSKGKDILSSLYDITMMVTIILSLFPLAFKYYNRPLLALDKITAVFFIVDYLLRLSTADFYYQKKQISSFLRYPFSFFAIIDLISILPSLSLLNHSFKLLRLFRMVRAFRVFRVFKALRYSKSFRLIISVFRRSKDALVAVTTLALAYILVAALFIFNVEPSSFTTFFDAIYWATVSLTTVGYGDIYPVTRFGQIVTMVSSLFGIAIIALPAGIITAGYMNALTEEKERQKALTIDKKNQSGDQAS